MEKYAFAKIINDLNSDLPSSRSDCFNYGSTWGCDKYCLQLQRGECELYENVDIYLEADKKY